MGNFDYERLTKRFNDFGTYYSVECEACPHCPLDRNEVCHSDDCNKVVTDRLGELEDKIEKGKLFFVPQNQDELLWVSSLLMIWSFGDKVENERLKEIYKELMEIKAKENSYE